MLKNVFKIIEQPLYLPLFKNRMAHTLETWCAGLIKWHSCGKTTKILGKKKCNLLKNINELAKI